MATADHTTFTQARMGRVPRIKRQPAKFRVRTSEIEVARQARRRQNQVTRTLLTGVVICASAYLLGLVIGSQIQQP